MQFSTGGALSEDRRPSREREPVRAGGAGANEKRRRGAAASILRVLAPSLVAAVLVAASAPLSRASYPIHSDPQLEERIDALIRRSVEFIYDGQIDSAQAAVDAAAAIAPHDPRVDLFRYRVLRENYPDDLNEEDRAKRLVPSLNAPLDRAIASCDSILALRKKDPAGTLYRGWAHMMKAQNYAIAGEIWDAGNESRKGKGDLDRYREDHPDDPDAGVIVGGYLYFADILPSVVKFLKFFARIPGGNKDAGLALLTRGAAAEDTYTGTDSKVVLAVINYLFEGRIDEAVATFEALAVRYPNNPRLVELLGSAALVFPEKSQQAIDAQTRVLDAWKTRVRGWDNLYYYRILWLRARLSNQVGEHEAARRDLERIVEVGPLDPFWLTPRALIGLANLSSSLGDEDAAHRCAARVLAEDGWSRYHAQARPYRDVRTSRRQQELFLALAGVRQKLYGRAPDPDEARRLVLDVRQRFGEDPRILFLDAEVHRQLGEIAEAREGYKTIADQANETGFESTRLMSCLRLGEIALAAKQYDESKRRFEQAREIESGYTLLGNVIRGRLRYIDEARKGRG
jgi:tetratricopeptide (TPR) repeat protein